MVRTEIITSHVSKHGDIDLVTLIVSAPVSPFQLMEICINFPRKDGAQSPGIISWCINILPRCELDFMVPWFILPNLGSENPEGIKECRSFQSEAKLECNLT